ncbi:DUF5809 family protein [Haloglomus litoreum]|uniref:DUF5809 family protein n=1 Tax=Haloglomus litoreum TaxID=3034026 RepID=UPI0023E765EE|nr:DUF5809 family protein [Haloglomus sp. DT116]
MKTEGLLAPESAAEARGSYADLAGAARTVTRETAKAMGFDREEYAERVTDDVRSTARDALFASLLEVRVGDREEFEAWRDDFDGDVRVMGSDEVPNVAWHVVPFGADGPPTRAAGDSGGRSPPGSRTQSGDEDVTPVAVAATFQDEPEAATATLRRTVFGRVYRDAIHADPVETGAHSSVPPEEDEDEGDGGDPQ